MKEFINKFFFKPPVIFPLVALFLIFLTINEFSIISIGYDDTLAKIRPYIMLLYTVFWIAATFFKRWGAMGFFLLSILGSSIYFFMPMTILQYIFGDILMLKYGTEAGIIPIPFNLIFSFILIYFYKLMK